jgi:hypothetical protein
MNRFTFIAILVVCYLPSCKQPSGPASMLPDVKPGFARALVQRDSLLILDSFYFLAIDTINEKKALIHERYPLVHIRSRINAQIDSVVKLQAHSPSQENLDQLDYLIEESTYVGKEIDSLSQRISRADSTTARGYRALYKVTVRKGSQFVVSDTVAYSIDLKGQMYDWDRGIEKEIDSLSVGKHTRQ